MSSDRLHWPSAIREDPRRLTAPLAGIDGWERTLWILVGVALVGDLLTTYYGLQLGLTESNPVARAALDRFGFAAMVGLKLFALAVGVGCRRLLPDEHGLLVPAGLAVPWMGAVVVNLSLYAIVLG
ncbi:DUF5658 family protein [Halorussus gelatinilyticus]|uniref:DUF5658 family protein n=1 Tax=Halorussus gelatinilyticus TaxID=2937524 RepID=A0A8U0IGT0_9EURY|nr:DUF5658 family protein [Halorussus gelatinilyticus]UPW00183.1 DUF5658 family protein [Halorussus gelatinilyticus]